jgi:hypothetical protein
VVSLPVLLSFVLTSFSPVVAPATTPVPRDAGAVCVAPAVPLQVHHGLTVLPQEGRGRWRDGRWNRDRDDGRWDRHHRRRYIAPPPPRRGDGRFEWRWYDGRWHRVDRWHRGYVGPHRRDW